MDGKEMKSFEEQIDVAAEKHERCSRMYEVKPNPASFIEGARTAEKIILADVSKVLCAPFSIEVILDFRAKYPEVLDESVATFFEHIGEEPRRNEEKK